MPPRLMDAAELADAIGTSQSDVLLMAKKGHIPSLKVDGKLFFSLPKVVGAIRTRQRTEQPAAVAAQ